jgi:hypothetical protein
MKAWHFLKKGSIMRDGRTAPDDGVMLRFEGEPIIRERGLHAGLDPFDALEFAPGPILCLVECGGTLIEESNKLVCTERTIIARMDATAMLRYFARMQALSVIHLWDAPDVVLDYLMTGHSSIQRAVRSAAWSATRSYAESAARSAAWSTAWFAAWFAARSATWSVTRSYAESAAWSAAESAAWSAAESAAWSAARQEFNLLVYECLE